MLDSVPRIKNNNNNLWLLILIQNRRKFYPSPFSLATQQKQRFLEETSPIDRPHVHNSRAHETDEFLKASALTVHAEQANCAIETRVTSLHKRAVRFGAD